MKNIKNISKSKIILIVVLLFLVLSIIVSILTKSNTSNIGVVNIEGVIMESREIVESLDEFNKRDDIQGILLRINSPGGAVAPSQEIYEKVKEISENNNKNIVTSIGSLGASGGYYIAIGSDKIFANPGSLVGSIGVIMNYTIAKDLFDKIGLKFETHKSGNLKDSGSLYRYSNAADDEYFQSIISDIHSQFIEEVYNRRKINKESLIDIANGQVFSGKMAYNNNLIDSLGTFEDALNLLKKMSNIEGEIKLIYPSKEKSSFLEYFIQNNISLENIIGRYNYKIPMFLLSK